MNPAHSPAITDASIYNPETGETWGEARARFATFGPALTEAELRALDPTTEVMSFGYGEDPEAFDGVEVAEVIEAIAEDGWDAVAGYWGPFAVWTLPALGRAYETEPAPTFGIGPTAEDPGNPEVAAAILAAAVEVDQCPSRYPEAGPHEGSDSLCPDCLEYDCGIEGHRDPADVNLCVWCMEYDVVEYPEDPS